MVFFHAATVCLCCFFIGLIFCTGAGEYWLKMFDSFAGTVGLVVIALLEMVAVIYIYGHEKWAIYINYRWNLLLYKIFYGLDVKICVLNYYHRFTEDIYQMTGYRPGTYWQWTWRYIGPVIMTCILVSSIVCLAIDKPSYSAYNAEEVWSPKCQN